MSPRDPTTDAHAETDPVGATPATRRAVAESVRAAFLDSLRSLDMSQVDAVAAPLAARLGDDGLLYVTGCGHSQLLALEGFHRAGAPAWVAPLVDERVSPLRGAGGTEAEGRPGLGAEIAARLAGAEARARALLVVSSSGESLASVEAAEKARSLGILTIALTRSRRTSLARAADHVLATGLAAGDALTEIHGVPMAPQSTVAGVALLHGLLAATESLRGEASCLTSVHGEEGAARNAALVARYPHLAPP